MDRLTRTIIVAGPNTLLLTGYGKALSKSYSVAEATDLPGLTCVLKSEQPQVAFVQSAIFKSSPYATLRTLSLKYSGVSFVMFGCSEVGCCCLSFLAAGARGLLPLSFPPELSSKVVAKVRAGELWVPRGALAVLLRQTDMGPNGESVQASHVSNREAQVARIAATGLSNKEIARTLDISERTVKAHISKLFEKLHMRSRCELMRLSLTPGDRFDL